MDAKREHTQTMIPFWLPALWIGAGFLLFPQRPLSVLLGYHGILALACLRRRVWRWGRLDRAAWAWLAAGAAALALPFLIPRLSCFPTTRVVALLATWPGGLWGHLPYALLVNVPLEEAFWRGAMEEPHGAWSPARQGAAFGLHHGVAAALTLPWIWIAPAFLATAAIGAFWTWGSRRGDGLGFALLSHALADLLLIFFVARQLG